MTETKKQKGIKARPESVEELARHHAVLRGTLRDILMTEMGLSRQFIRESAESIVCEIAERMFREIKYTNLVQAIIKTALVEALTGKTTSISPDPTAGLNASVKKVVQDMVTEMAQKLVQDRIRLTVIEPSPDSGSW